MKVYLNKSVFDAALTRIRWIFDTFDNVIVNFSGGKDSTITLELALMVAREKNRLPLKVFFIDQEAEWECVIKYIREVMSRDEVEPLWLQCPLQLFNATSTTDSWLQCWNPDDEEKWIRPREENSIHDNPYGTKTFAKLFTEYTRYHYPDESCARIGGVRCEESPARQMGLTTYATFKHVTWGKIEDKAREHFAFYPIYDWSYIDVWKAVHDNDWSYCELYDLMYQYGIPIREMRVSNVHHETAVKTLFFLQELEPKTWERVVSRLSGINSAGMLKQSFLKPRKLPPMFSNWHEYRDHLLENLVDNDEHKEAFRKWFKAYDERYVLEAHPSLVREQIQCILVNDWMACRMAVFDACHGRYSKTGKYLKDKKLK